MNGRCHPTCASLVNSPSGRIVRQPFSINGRGCTVTFWGRPRDQKGCITTREIATFWSYINLRKSCLNPLRCRHRPVLVVQLAYQCRPPAMRHHQRLFRKKGNVPTGLRRRGQYPPPLQDPPATILEAQQCLWWGLCLMDRGARTFSAL